MPLTTTNESVITTVGTSLLTNGAESGMQQLLRETANLPESAFTPETLAQVNTRSHAVRENLLTADDARVRRMSAELNGLLAMGDPSRKHVYLLHTDTHQGAVCARVLAEWIQQHGASGIPVRLEKLTTANSQAFSAGVDFLLDWTRENCPLLQKKGRVTFNLVGGFKAMQAYCHTLGMFYADEVIYLFEGSSSELIRIPRLPISFDSTPLNQHASAFARLEAGDVLPTEELQGVPPIYLEQDGDCATLSKWGVLGWGLEKSKILAGDLLEQPGLQFADTFRRDYNACNQPEHRIALQSALARVAILWRDGGLGALRNDTSLRYETYKKRGGNVGHFRLHNSRRVSCRPDGDQLVLRKFGPHDFVNDNP